MAQGDSPWLVPMYFERVHLTKPPGNYWLMAASIRVWGEGEFALRFPAALAASLSLGLCFWFCDRIYGRATAYNATALLAVTPLFVGVGRLGITDSPLTLCTNLALVAGAMTLYTNKIRYSIVLWAATAGALWIKGPVGLLPAGVLLGWRFGVWMGWLRGISEPNDATDGRDRLCLRGDMRGGVRGLRGGWGLPLAVLPILGWIGYVVWRQPEAWTVWNYEMVSRATGAGDHPEPWWYFLPVFLLGLLPASLIWLIGLFRSLNQVHPDVTDSDSPPPPFLGLWVIMIVTTLLVFSLISGKLMTYLLPICFPLAMLAAISMRNFTNTEFSKYSVRLRQSAFLILVSIFMGLTVVEDRLADRFSGRDVVQQVRSLTGVDRPRILTVGWVDRTMAYYADQPTQRVDPRLTPELWDSLPKTETVLLATPVAWAGFTENPHWDPADRYVEVGRIVKQRWSPDPLDVYRFHPRHR